MAVVWTYGGFHSHDEAPISWSQAVCAGDGIGSSSRCSDVTSRSYECLVAPIESFYCTHELSLFPP